LQNLQRHLVGAEIIRQIEFARRAGLGANCLAAKLQGGVRATLAAHQETLAVVIGDAGEHQAERCLA
jgi:hypothetical protein